MKTIILAAGEGVRIRPLTDNTPKPMLKILNKPILAHILDSLPEEINEVILVVGYLKEKILNYFGNNFGRFQIQYVNQSGRLGTYHALTLCKDLIKDNERFLMLYADDLHGKEGLAKCVNYAEYSLLIFESENPNKFGAVELDETNYIIGIEEKPEHPRTNLVSTGVMVLDKNIFKYPARQHPNGEYYLTSSIDQMIQNGCKFKAIRSDFWIPIGYPEDISKAEKILGN